MSLTYSGDSQLCGIFRLIQDHIDTVRLTSFTGLQENASYVARHMTITSTIVTRTVTPSNQKA